MNKSKDIKLKPKKIFFTKGTCSHTLFYILNREFGHPKEHEERALDPMAGGILQQGYQCGFIWGAAMGVGAESFRKYKDQGQAIVVAIKTTQKIMESFEKTANCIDCEDFTKTDFSNKWQFAKYMLTGKFYSCFKLADKWAPKAIKVAQEGLASDTPNYSLQPISCASEVIKQMGGTEEEMLMVAGFAGGLGLTAGGCGALSAAIWKTILELVKKDQWKSGLSDPDSEEVLNRFYEATDYEMECHKICGKKFNTIDEHTEYIQNGGCKHLIDALALKT